MCNIGSQHPDVDDLDLWHRRLADTSYPAIREAVCNKLIEGVTDRISMVREIEKLER